MPFCGDVTGVYWTEDRFHEIILIQDDDEDNRLYGLYRNATVFIFLGLIGDVGHPDYDSRVLTVTHAAREASLTLTGNAFVFDCLGLFK